MPHLQHVLIIGSVWPEPASSAAGSRMMQLLDLFLAEGWKITFASAAGESAHMTDLESLGIEKVNIELNDSDFDRFIETLNPAIVLFDRFMTEEQFGWRVARMCPDALRILDTEDLHCLRMARQKACLEDRPFNEKDLLREEVSKREIASIFRCDLSLIISNVEMDLLQRLFKVDEDNLHYLPFLLDPVDATTIRNGPGYEFRKHFVTIGNFLHEPNWDAVLFLKEEVWPRIREKLPDVELHIYGAYPSQKVHDLHQPEEGFLVKGRADDAKAVISRARVCLAPLRFGAGIKGKLVEAMQCGTPNVTTPIGAEAMHGYMDWGGIIADGSDQLASAAAELYSNPSLWQKAQENGIRILNHRFQKTVFGPAWIQRLVEVQNNLAEHRLNNFIGAMLRHHTLASTRYMSQWIEEKNKRGDGC